MPREHRGGVAYKDAEPRRGHVHDGLDFAGFLGRATIDFTSAELLQAQAWGEHLHTAIALWRHRQVRRGEGGRK